MILQIPIESFAREFTLTVEVDHTPAERESRDCHGSAEENDITAVFRDGENITHALSEAEWEQLGELVDDMVAERIEQAEEDAQVSDYEERQARMVEECESGRYDP